MTENTLSETYRFGSTGDPDEAHELAAMNIGNTLCGMITTEFLSDIVADALRMCPTCEQKSIALDELAMGSAPAYPVRLGPNLVAGVSMPSKYDPIRDEVAAGIDRVRSLVAEGKNDEAKTVTEETEALIGSLPAKERAEHRRHMEEAGTPKKVHEGTVMERTLETPDWEKVGDAKKLVAETAKELSKRIKDQIDAGSYAYGLAEKMLQIRLRMSNKHGVPDLLVRGPETRKAANAVYTMAGREFEENFDTEDALSKVMTAVYNRNSDVMVAFINSLDENHEEYERWFPTIAAENPEKTPSQAVRDHYEGIGQALPVKGKRQLAREDYARKKKALAAGQNPKELEEGGTPDERVTGSAKKLSSALNKLTVEDLSQASDETKKQARKAIDEILEKAKALLSATV